MDFPKEDYEVIIVDGHSVDHTVKIAEKYGCKVVYENVGTIGGARNTGVKHSSGKYIVFTDVDCVVERSWMNALITTLEESNIASAGGPNLTPEDDSDFAKSVGAVLSFLSQAGARYGFNAEGTQQIYHNPTCNVAYRREVFLESGGFNGSLITCDDEELDYRLLEKGHKIVYTSNARVLHYRRPTYKKFMKMAFNYGVGRMQVTKLHRGMGKWFHYMPITTIVLLSLLSALSFTNPFFGLLALITAVAGGVGIGVMSAYLTTRRHLPFFTEYVLILIWFFGYGFGTLRGVFE